MTQFFTKLASGLTALALVASFVPSAALAQDGVEIAVDDTTPVVVTEEIGAEGEAEDVSSDVISNPVLTVPDEGTGDLSEGDFENANNSAFSAMTVDFEPSAVSVTYTVDGGDMSELQTVVNNANNGDVVVVSGTYTGNLTISKDITVKSASGPSSASIVDGYVTIDSGATGASFEGFTVQNPNGSYGIIINGASNVNVSGNTVTQIGSTLSEGGAQAIYIVGSSAMSNIVINGNAISAIGSLDLKYSVSTGASSAKGIYVGDSNHTTAVTGLQITDNTITDVEASTAAWNTGRGAYGILINRGGVSGATEATISGNTISDLEGLWAHGIGLEANTPNTTLSGNTISDLTDHKNGTDAHAIFFEKNASKTSVEINGSTAGSLNEVVVNPAWVGYANNPVVTHDGKNYIFGVNATTTLKGGVDAVSAAGTVFVYPGDYNLVKDDATSVSGQTGWYLALTKDGITLQGVAANGQNITNASGSAANIYSTQETANGSWSTQNLITVFADNVTLQGLTVMNKLSPNKGIEVLGNGFTAKNNRFAPIPTSILPSAANYSDPDGSTGNDISKYGSGVYFNNNGATTARTGTVTGNIFQNSGVTFDSFGDNWTMTVTGNTFDGNKVWADGSGTYYYSAIGATTWANPSVLDFSGSDISVNQNKFINMVAGQLLLKTSRADMVGTFEASQNWWGTAIEAEIQALVSAAHVTISSWYTDEAMTTLNTDPAPSSGGRSGGSSRSSSNDSDSDSNAGEVAGASTTGGEVLGASTFNFTMDLTIGSTGAEVTALQTMLIASGDLVIAAPTGYFGEMTRAALAKWQAAHGVMPASGYFGPITRAAVVAAGTPAPTMSAEARAALIKDLLEKVKELQDKLTEMEEDAA